MGRDTAANVAAVSRPAGDIDRLLHGAGPILSVFLALIVHSELKSVHPGFPVAFISKHKLGLINK